MGTLPSLNDYTKACRGNRYSGATMKKKQEKLICTAIREAVLRGSCKPMENYPTSIEIVWYEPNSRRDIDNITFATKFILDALVKSGILKDDSRKYVSEISHRVTTDKGCPRIEVTIKNAEPNDKRINQDIIQHQSA